LGFILAASKQLDDYLNKVRTPSPLEKLEFFSSIADAIEEI
jgi:hypothetical protein